MEDWERRIRNLKIAQYEQSGDKFLAASLETDNKAREIFLLERADAAFRNADKLRRELQDSYQGD